MNWHSWSDFLAMGGYALYVWGAVLTVIALLFAELFSLRLRRKALVRQYTRRTGTIPNEKQA
jgi:heme exporter protein D